MPSRLSLIFQLTTAPTNRSDASPHIAGWSESWWTKPVLASGDLAITSLANKRSYLLPAQAQIVGYRIAVYTIAQNRLIPNGTASGKLQINGNSSYACDLPQMALEMAGSTSEGPNSSRFTCRGMPDSMMTLGEYQPDSTFKGYVTGFCNQLSGAGWAFLGRDLTKPKFKVLSIAGNVVTLAGPIGALAGTDWMRFSHVTLDNDKPLKGTFLITAAGAGNTYTLAGLSAVLTTPNGTARVDGLVVNNFSKVAPNRAVVRKVGRPFESYRGKASRK